MDNKVADFMNCMAKLETMEFVGLAKVLKVELAQEDNKEEMRPFENIIQDMLQAYVGCNRKRRRDLLKMLKSLTKGRDYYHAEFEGSYADQENFRAAPEEE